jgi:hypothetical protein
MTKPMLFFLLENPHLWCIPHGNCAGKQEKNADVYIVWR